MRGWGEFASLLAESLEFKEMQNIQAWKCTRQGQGNTDVIHQPQLFSGV